MTFEENIKASFRDVKMEIISIKNQILQLADEMNELKQVIKKSQSSSKSSAGKKATKKRVVKKRK